MFSGSAILPPIHLNDGSGMLYWKSAPYQTPRYLDGLQVLVSTTGNFDSDFSDTLKLFAEYISGEPLAGDSSFTNYVFSDGFVFGMDGQYVEYHSSSDSSRLRGVLRPDSASLASYANMDIYIAFCSGSTDDNLMSIDDIMVTGSGNFVSIADPLAAPGSLSVFPNPATDQFSIEYSLSSTTPVQLEVYDEAGRLMKSVTRGTQIKGNYHFDVDIRNLSNGLYNVSLKTSAGTAYSKITKL